MAKIPDRSAYLLELSVQPGGSRWAEVHVYSKLEHIRAWLEEFCKNESMGAYHAIWYGATLAIWVAQKGQIVQCIDLHPHIKASLDGSDAVPLADRDGCVALLRKGRKTAGEDEEADEAGDDDWSDDDLETLDRMKLEFSWVDISAQLPALEPPLLMPGQRIRIKHKKKPKIDTYVENGAFAYGSYDHEGGADLEPPFEVEEPDEIEEEEDD